MELYLAISFTMEPVMYFVWMYISNEIRIKLIMNIMNSMLGILTSTYSLVVVF